MRPMITKLSAAAGLLLFIGWMISSFESKQEIPVSLPMPTVEVSLSVKEKLTTKVAVPLPRPRPVVQNDRECLARNLAFETAPLSHLRTGISGHLARQEMEAIYRVMLRRQSIGRAGGYADTLCEVVYQKAQFSWTLKLPQNAVPTAPGRWEFFLAVADELLAGKLQHHWPEENACIENYKRTDNRGVGRNPARWFKKNRESVIAYEDHTFSCPKPTAVAAKKQLKRVASVAR